MHFRSATLEISTTQGTKSYLLQPNQANSFDELYVDFQVRDEADGERYTLYLHPKEDLVVQGLALEFDPGALCPDVRFMANGFQSWSESRYLPLTEHLPRLRHLARPFMGLYGDEHLPGIPRGRGFLHSWTYAYWQRPGGLARFAGSLNEQTGFTLFVLDQRNGTLRVQKDLSGLQLAHSFPALDLWLSNGPLNGVFDRYFALFHQNLPFAPDHGRYTRQAVLGWTSWYRYFNRISEAIILGNAGAVADSGFPFRYFQIDDGWQTAVGDWRSVKPDFPRGMGPVAAAIREKGLVPGLWLAPFVASGKSDLARRHPEWLLKDRKGRPIRAGWNPMWGGWYHALDFYHPGVQDYLSGVFHIVLDQWGYGLLKLDFLFAVCLAPPPGKTRGQVMHEAMAFLRRLMGEREMLACGVPLGSAFGLADICRTGGDVHLDWEHRLLAFLRHRERVSTVASLRSTLGRWPLNRRAFVGDPDVFILRDAGQRLTLVQQNTLLTLNALLGGILFTSDDVSAYTPEQRFELEEALGWRGSVISRVEEVQPDVYVVSFVQEGKDHEAYCNLTRRPVAVDQTKNGRITLQPFETLVL